MKIHYSRGAKIDVFCNTKQVLNTLLERKGKYALNPKKLTIFKLCEQYLRSRFSPLFKMSFVNAISLN
jgi:hypothetical protein